MNAAIINDINYCKYVKPQTLLIENISASPGVAVQLSATPVYFRKAVLRGAADVSGTANADTVMIGTSQDDDEQPYPIPPNGERILEAPTGAKWDLRDWYASPAATTGTNGLIITLS